MPPSRLPSRLRFQIDHEATLRCVPPESRVCKVCGVKLEPANYARLPDLCPPCADRIRDSEA